MINIHLILAGLYMPLMLMMPFTGAMYILGYQGSQTSTEAFKSREIVPEGEAEREAFFRELFKKQGIDFNFEYVRVSKNDFIFRPQSRDHYVAVRAADGELTFSKIEPTLLKRMIELHKGHGPVAMRWFEASFGLALILTTLSGLYLAWTAKAYRKPTLISFGIGAVVIVFCLI